MAGMILSTTHLPLLEDGARRALVVALVTVGGPQLVHSQALVATAAHAGLGRGVPNVTVQLTGERLTRGRPDEHRPAGVRRGRSIMSFEWINQRVNQY
jgi:hypothetical protein